MSREARLVVNQLISDMQTRPDDFECDEYKLLDRKTNFEYWVANMFFDAKIYRPYELHFGIVHGFRFHSALIKWKAARMLSLSRGDA